MRLVLVERADRLARDLLVSEVILGQFCDLGVRIVAADSGTDLTAADEDSTRVLIRRVLGAVAQFEKSVIVAKLRAARMRRRRATGRCEGRKRFGEHLDERAVLQRIRQPASQAARARPDELRGDRGAAQCGAVADEDREGVLGGNGAADLAASERLVVIELGSTAIEPQCPKCRQLWRG